MTKLSTTLPKKHKKHYVETIFERFFAWPKSFLVGNQFHYKKDNSSTYSLDVRVPKKKKNILLLFFVSMLFHLFRPMNFLLMKIVNANKYRQKIRAEITKQHLGIKLDKKDIKLNKDERSYEKIISAFLRKDDELQTRFSLFYEKISKPEDWNKL